MLWYKISEKENADPMDPSEIFKEKIIDAFEEWAVGNWEISELGQNDLSQKIVEKIQSKQQLNINSVNNAFWDLENLSLQQTPSAITDVVNHLMNREYMHFLSGPNPGDPEAVWEGAKKDLLEDIRKRILETLNIQEESEYCMGPLIGRKYFNLKKIAGKNKINSSTKKSINQELHDLTTPNNKTVYFEQIPLKDIGNMLSKYNLVILQEDNTEWSGFLLGENSQTNFTLGYKNPVDPSLFLGEEEEEDTTKNQTIKQYEPIDNAFLMLSWYRMPSGRYEIVAYIS